MEDKEIKEKIKELRGKYLDLEEITIEYNGAGDSFDSMYSNTDGVDSKDYEDLVFALINKVGSNFNNDGSYGTVTINLLENTIRIEDYYNYTESSLNQDITI